MHISTRYNIEDGVYFMKNNRVEHARVVDIFVRICGPKIYGEREKSPRPIITYTLHSGESYSEKDLFFSKEELLKTL